MTEQSKIQNRKSKIVRIPPNGGSGDEMISSFWVRMKNTAFVLPLLLLPGNFADAQSTARIGLLLPQIASSEPDRSRVKIFQQGLAEIGYFEGKNLVIEYRSAEGKLDRLLTLAAEMVALKVDVIAAKQIGLTIPSSVLARADKVIK